MSPVRFHPAARSELLQSARFYESQCPGLGRRFGRAVRAALQRIKERPMLYRAINGDVRFCRVFRFPYAVMYRTTADSIQVLAVMPLHRRPRYWLDRA